jgi:hypothetical protein
MGLQYRKKVSELGTCDHWSPQALCQKRPNTKDKRVLMLKTKETYY